MSSGISIIMATYNGENYLEEQLQSIFNQSLHADELIVSDDHSRDSTCSILQQYSVRNLLKYKINIKGSGVISNFKSAAEDVNPVNYVAFADQDDIWELNKLSLSLKKLKTIEVPELPCMVYGDPQIINSNGDTIAGSLWDILGFNNYTHTLQTVLFGNPAGGCTMLINPALAKFIPTIPDDAFMHDAWLTLIAYTFGKASIIPEPILRYRQHANNVTFSTNFKPQNRFKRVLEELRKAFNGKSDLFSKQFPFIRQFYNFFYADISPDKRVLFENFLALENAGYFKKKLAFRKAYSKDL